MGRPLADFATRILSPVTERQAGMTLDLLGAWEEIAGPVHARHTRPERLRWPRGDVEEFSPATLVVACEGAHAVFFQHETKVLMERLNGYFGFAAVDRVQVVQRPVRRREERPERRQPTLPRAAERDLGSRLEGVADERLKAALRRLGRGVIDEGR